MKRRLWTLLIFVIVYSSVRYINRPPAPETSWSGKIACLPPKTGTTVTTLQCAIGLQTDSGDYYALDTSELTNPIISYPNDTFVEVDGRLSGRQKNTSFASKDTIVVNSIKQ